MTDNTKFLGFDKAQIPILALLAAVGEPSSLCR